MESVSQVWFRIQATLLPFLREELDPITEKQEQLISILELVRIEDFVRNTGQGWPGRPPSDRQALARAFVAKAFYNMTTTDELIERLKGCRNLRRICGFERASEIPDASTFSRAFSEFSDSILPELVHENLIKNHRASQLVGHISRDSTEVEAREKPMAKPVKPKKSARKRGRPRKGEEPEPRQPTLLERQVNMGLGEMKATLPNECDVGSKKDSKGFSHSWTGYKLHIDTADGGVPISCILTSASVHDSQVALPLMQTTAARVTSLYDVMDAAYDASIIRDQSEKLGHVPIIDNNPRRGEKIEMDPAKKERYKIRSSAERVNARLKDEFGARQLRVKGPRKTMAHLMFGVLVLAADQLLRLAV
jgi:transposase/IS5 family transposase